MSVNQPIKLFAFDLDGTLLTDDKIIADETMSSLKELFKRGIEVVPVTGRPISAIPKELLENPDIHYIISANGARITDQRNKENIYEKLLPMDIAEGVLTTFGKYDCIREIYYDGIAYVDEKDANRIGEFHKGAATVEYFRNTRNPVKDMMGLFYKENREIDKAQGIFKDMDELMAAKAELEKRGDIKITRALINNIEVNLKSVNKGTALERLIGILGIDKDEVVAVGDGDNDIEMLTTSGIGVAMGNGVQEIKDIADDITADNNHGGVEKVIKKYILK